ncbi:MAG: hypothetical protein B6D55_03480 [Candidatus Omnitrophica bacterium 4484_70.2]|nr:MAG: hypothetical protein B6D55_03480 [Candidatus Omnitrophica bacterium 4484_70.2]
MNGRSGLIVMAKVQILPPEIVNKIAAGEVIERPASVVKELIENAIDAHTTSIELNLKQSGKTLIHIKDTGVGIDPDDMEKIFLRHATSKIYHLNDLYRINSLGFRGEALYSIAAISDITLRSKPSHQDVGWEIHLRGGEKQEFKPISMPAGTEVIVKELFFNTPARRKFLKSNVTELHHIFNTCVPYILQHYQCRFLITHNNREVINLPPHQDVLDRIVHTLQINREDLLYRECQLPEENLSFSLILGDINIQRPRRDMQFIFVNNRPVQNKLLSFYLNQVYQTFIPSDANPFFCIFLSLPGSDVDVNVHPTKREVKLKKGQRIATILSKVCEETLLSYGKARRVSTSLYLSQDSSSSTQQKNQYLPNSQEERPASQYVLSDHKSYSTYRPYEGKSINRGDEDSSSVVPLSSQPSDIPQQLSLRRKLKEAHYIGSFLKKYLLFETTSSLLIVDQHAAQERITYETILSQVNEGGLQVQYLVNPILIPISAQEKIIWEAMQKKLEELGFSTTQWNEETIALHSSPSLIKNPAAALRNLLSGDESLLRADNETLIRRACRNSLMAGYEVVKEQAEFIRDQLLSCKIPFSCPHGRPTVVEIDQHTLDKEFFRR